MWELRDGILYTGILCLSLFIVVLSVNLVAAQSGSENNAEERQQAFLEELHLLFPGESEWRDDVNEWLKSGWKRPVNCRPISMRWRAYPFIPDPLRMQQR
jgi:hypothetical protein